MCLLCVRHSNFLCIGMTAIYAFVFHKHISLNNSTKHFSPNEKQVLDIANKWYTGTDLLIKAVMKPEANL